jgi:hypoxanthine-DNA glycosylase
MMAIILNITTALLLLHNYRIMMVTNAKNKIEVHPFEPFAPAGTKYLIIGSFPGKGQTEIDVNSDHWFYGAKRNTFWKILEGVYNISLQDKRSKQQLFIKTKMGIADIILKAIRKNNTNSDADLEIIEMNDVAIKKILESRKLVTIFFTSKFVEKLFKKVFPSVSNTIVLPSPSPRFATMSLPEKISIYKKYLPSLKDQL